MDALRFTLVGEGPSDKNLIPILAWALREQGVGIARGNFARWDMLPNRPKTIVEKIVAGLGLYECDLLFVHRDADQFDPNPRREEVLKAVIEANIRVPAVPVIPIQETEAWLLIDQKALRRAANYPNGRCEINLPSLKNIEKCRDPKMALQRALREASEQSPQRLKRFDIPSAIARVVDHISDFRPLRNLTAFKNLESDLAVLRARGWK